MRSCVSMILLLTALLASPFALSQPAQALADMRQQSEQALQALQASVAARGGEAGRRSRLLLVLARAEAKAVAEADLAWLETYRQRHPQDVFGKLYEGYGWLLVADRYMQQQNYFRAAELAKRGFFLVDEAVDEHPANWRLRLLRVRMDVAVPVEFGRYVVALDDLRELAEMPALPPALGDLLVCLEIRALNAAGRSAESSALRGVLDASPLAAVADGEAEPFLTPGEIEHVLKAVLETADE